MADPPLGQAAAPTAGPRRAGSCAVPLTERLAEGLWLAAGLVIPSVFDYAANQAFELPKLVVLSALGPTAAVLAVMGAGLGGVHRIRQPLALAGITWLMVVTLATLTSVAPTRGLWGSYERQSGLLAGIALVTLATAPALGMRRPDQYGRLAVALVLGSVGPVLYAAIQRAGLDHFAWLGRPLGVTSTLGSSTALGGYLAAMLPLTLALALRADRAQGRERRITPPFWRLTLLATLFAAQASALLLTSVRGALVAAVVGCAAALLAARAHGHRSGAGRRRAVILAAAIVTVALAGVVTIMRGSGGLAERFSPRNDETVAQRFQIWQAAGQALLQAGPRLLTGYGPETQADSLEPWLPSGLIRPLPTIRVDRAHLSPLDVMLTTGALGAMATAAVWWLALGSAWRAAASSPALRPYAAGAFGALTAHLVETSVAFPSITSLTIVALLVGSLIALQTWSTRTPLPPSPASRAAMRWPRRLGPFVALAIAVASAAPFLGRLQADRAYQRSLALWANEQPSEAIALAGEARRLAPDQDVYTLAVAQQLLDAAMAAPRDDGRRPTVLDGDPDAYELLRRSVEASREAVSLAPTDPFAWAALARSLGAAADAQAIEPSSALGEAQLAAANAVKHGPRRSALRDLAGRLAMQSGAYAEALAILSETMDVNGQDAERLAEVGHAQRALGNVSAAQRAYEQALKLDERSATTWWGLSQLSLDLEELPQALEAAQRAARFQMGNWRYRRDLGHVLLRLGSAAEARDELRAAARLAPSWEWPALRAEIDGIRP